MISILRLILCVQLFISLVSACRCVQSTLSSSLENNDVVGRFYPLYTRRENNSIYTRAYTVKIFKKDECGEDIPRFVWIKTADNSAACGVKDLARWRTHLLSGHVMRDAATDPSPMLYINSCQYQKPWSELTEKELSILETLPKATKHSVCPVNKDPDACASDDDCDSEKDYCAGGSCRPHGSCRNTRDCFNPANDFFIRKRCYYYLECNDDKGVCDGVCSASECADGSQPVNCLQAPCDAHRCDDDYASCRDDYCGGCNALFFDPRGDPTCDGN